MAQSHSRIILQRGKIFLLAIGSDTYAVTGIGATKVEILGGAWQNY